MIAVMSVHSTTNTGFLTLKTFPLFKMWCFAQITLFGRFEFRFRRPQWIKMEDDIIFQCRCVKALGSYVSSKTHNGIICSGYVLHTFPLHPSTSCSCKSLRQCLSRYTWVFTQFCNLLDKQTLYTHIQSSLTHHSLHRAALEESQYSFRHAKRLCKTVMTSEITMIVVTNKTLICRAHRSSWGLCAVHICLWHQYTCINVCSLYAWQWIKSTELRWTSLEFRSRLKSFFFVFFAVSKIGEKKMRTIFEEMLKPECLWSVRMGLFKFSQFE